MEEPPAGLVVGEDGASGTKGRKRTKTGCLTCRKRRIKCGEERPICKNCVKSKRHCDGYNQRVVFKPPAFDYRPVPHGGLHITFPADPGHFNGIGNRWNTYGMPSGQMDLETAMQQHPIDPQAPLRFASGDLPNHPAPREHYPQHSDPIVHQQISAPQLDSASAPNALKANHTPEAGGHIPSLQTATYSTDLLPAVSYPGGEQSYSTNQAQLVSGHNLFRSVDGRPVHDLSAHSVLDFANPTQLLHSAAIETHNGGYYDLYHNEDIYGDISTTADGSQHNALSSILRLNSISIQDLQTRRYDTFLYAGMLDTYRVERVASPLNNPATARIFAHFLSSTAPSLSIFERHPRNTSVLFTSGRIPFSEQGLWTYTMPNAALHNQGLLHAMLALGSLHIARLTGAARTPSVQHYAWALKRVHHSVGHPQKRLEIATIAASMLLGYYEIIAADHMKWNLHLAGSKQLFLETDFVGMTQRFREMKLARAAELQAESASPHSSQSQGDLLDQIPDIDERIVSRFVGREIRYGERGYIDSPRSSVPTSLDLSDFEVLKDLFWWYCKQDAYMSVTGGIPLLLDYSRWADCPPRAPLGKIDAVYGSFDHLTLLLGRVADFAARDRVRKTRQVAANGGSWRPHKDMNMPAPPSASGQAFSATPESQPSFYGMAPPPRTAGQMPSSYHTPVSHNSYEPNGVEEQSDLSAATEAAVQDYNNIRSALHQFSQSLGESFAPLASEYQPPMETPFGPALFYRNYDIGCLWAIYNMTVLILIRSHPHMPPAAHMAAAVAAKETEFYANEIGRISAGIVPDSPDRPLSPALGAALCESCMPSFFAAIQYKDAAQRETTVKRIFGISRRTGWGSAELIANGCETAWVKAAAAGRGPPYTRLGRQENSDDPRLNGSWEKLDPDQDPDEKDDGDRRLVKKSPRARLLWGIGVIGEERDETVKH